MLIVAFSRRQIMNGPALNVQVYSRKWLFVYNGFSMVRHPKQSLLFHYFFLKGKKSTQVTAKKNKRPM